MTNVFHELIMNSKNFSYEYQRHIALCFLCDVSGTLSLRIEGYCTIDDYGVFLIDFTWPVAHI